MNPLGFDPGPQDESCSDSDSGESDAAA